MQNMKVSLTIAVVMLRAKQDKQVTQVSKHNMIQVSAKRQVTTSRELVSGITTIPGDEDVCRCSLPWREATSPLERWMLPRRHTNATKAHPILLEKSPRRRFSTTSGRPWGGLQTLTNFPGVITMVDSSPNDS